MLEDRQCRPGTDLDLRRGVFGQDAGQVFGDSAACDVRHARRQPRRHQLLSHMEVAAMGLHQRRAGLFLDGGHVLRGLVAGHLEHQLVCQ